MLDYRNPELRLSASHTSNGRIRWQSPSNIAIVKYWGKHGRQLPRNPSVSFTLQNALSETALSYQPRTDNRKGIQLYFTFEGQPRLAFAQKISSFLESILDIYPFLEQLDLSIDSYNTFPHSAGIASSASSMSALVLCLCSMEQQLFGTLQEESAFLQKASYLARLASGSACRSVYPAMALWGEVQGLSESSDLYAIPVEHRLHPVFRHFHDDILIVSKGEKSVSSRAGHQLMEGNIYAESRYTQARQNLNRLMEALHTGDLDTFGQIAESEALTLHALMMCSEPPFILMQPNTLTLIKKVQGFRSDTGYPLYFTLDAGPNLHLLYPHDYQEAVQAFIRSELQPYCEGGQWLEDQAGSGPLRFE